MRQYQHLTVLGDSITDQRNHYAHQWYYQWLADWLAIPKTTNLGISGSTIAQPYDPMVNRWQQIPTETDLLLIYAGINDFGRDVPLGQLGDQTTVTFYGALQQMLGQISKHYPQATIYFISHVKIGTDFFPAINQSGYRQVDYEKAIVQVTELLGIRHISLFNQKALSFADAQQAEAFSLDSLHPNDAGHEKIAQFLKTKINH